jgi:hypothetical protein
MTEQEIIDEMEKILAAQAHWKSAQDGSYEMALHYAGYSRLSKQLKELREKKNDNQ